MSLRKNYFYNLILTIFNILFPILSFPYASRVLGPLGIGKFQFITSFAQYFILIASLGIPTYGTREIAKYKGKAEKQSVVFSELLSISFIMSVLLTVIYLVTVISFNYFSYDKHLYLIASISILVGFTSIDWLYVGLEEFKMIAVRSVIIKLVSLILLYTLVKSHDDLEMYLYISIFSAVANNAYNLYTVRKKVKITFSNLELRKHTRPLLLIFSLSLAVSMYTLLDVVLLGFLSNARYVGLYSAAVKLTKIVIPFITSVGTVTMPQISHQFAEGNLDQVKSVLDKSLHFILFFAIPSFAGLILLAPECIVMFSGAKFLEGTISMQILALLPIAIGLGYFWGIQILIPAGKDKEMVYSVVGGMLIAVTLNFVLVPRLKDVGASIANVVTEFAVTGFYIYFVKKNFSFSFGWATAFKSVAASLLFVPIILLTRSLNLGVILTLGISVITCGVTYVSIQWFVFKDHLINDLYVRLLEKFKGKTMVQGLE
ncbi:flippase [Mucilaginibacter lacusdianchii]|uniref:flippase n=1 Tax=Mucilaginibacter lacusdianchii TaxID=2684211 RepID=UPI00131B2A3B|nr:flippase [Mucilaginibacter sp. JXJ CY 39]